MRLAELFSRHGHRVTLISPDGPLVPQITGKGVGWIEADFYGRPVAILRAVMAVRAALRQGRFSVVHCQMARPVLFCLLANFLAGRPAKVVWHSRGLRAHTYRLVVPLYGLLGASIIANCRTEMEKIASFGFDRRRISFTYNALPVFSTAGDGRTDGGGRTVIGSISRLELDRNVGEALEIFSKLAAGRSDVELWIAGDGSQKNDLVEKAERLGLGERVRFLGAVSDIGAFFSGIDIMVNTINLAGDNGAGVGNNILEAGVAAKPVVTYGCAGIPEMIVDGITGDCVPVDMQDRFLTRLRALVDDRALRERYGAALHEHVTKLCADDEIYKATLELYCR